MRFFKPAILIVISAIIIIVLRNLFPFTGLQAIILFPLMVIITIVIALLFSWVDKRIKSSLYKKSFFIITLILVSYINIAMYPSSKNLSPFVEFRKTITVLLNYDNIKYQNIFPLSGDGFYYHNNPLNTIALYKYQKFLPDRVFVIGYYEEYRELPLKSFYLEKRNNHINTNNKQLIKKQTDSATVFYEIYKDKPIEFVNPFDKQASGYSYRFGGIDVYFDEVSLKPQSGFYKLVYNILHFTKLPLAETQSDEEAQGNEKQR